MKEPSPKKLNLNKPLPKMTDNKKYVITTICLLFAFTVGYSVYVIYQNKYHHTGVRFSLVNLLTGKDSTPTSLKKSAIAVQSTKQNNQYNTKPVESKPVADIEISQRQIVTNFYNEYLNNKKSNHSQSDTLAKYGTANLVDQYNNSTSGIDTISCSVVGKNPPLTSAAITNSEPLEGQMNYTVQFNDKNGITSSAQVKVTNQAADSKIDGVGCLVTN